MVALRPTIISAYSDSILDDTRLSTSAHQDSQPGNTMISLGRIISQVSLRRIRVLAQATTRLPPNHSYFIIDFFRFYTSTGQNNL